MSAQTCALINIVLNLIQICLLVAGIGCFITALIPKTQKKKTFALLGVGALAVSFAIPQIINILLNVTPHGPS